MNILFPFLAVLGFFTTILTLVAIVVFSIDYSVYMEGAKKGPEKWNYGTFEDFRREMVAKDWTMRQWQKLGSEHFYFNNGKDPISSFSRFNIEFCKNKMILNRREYFKYRKYLKTLNKIKSESNQDTSLWKQA